MQNLAMMRGQSHVNDVLNGDDVVKTTFVSHFDGQEDNFAVLPPRASKPPEGFDLVIYLHGMGSTFLEPFVCPDSEPIARRICNSMPDVVFASLNYRRAWSWGNDGAISDITQNIREITQQYPINRIVIMGTSMGGCTALTYTAIAPDDVKAKIIGAVSAEGAGDLVALFKQTKNHDIPPALVNAFGGSPEYVGDKYAKQSFLTNVDKLKGTERFAIISATHDAIVPPQMQKEIVSILEGRKNQTRLIEVDSGHGVMPASDYLEGLRFVLSKN